MRSCRMRSSKPIRIRDRSCRRRPTTSKTPYLAGLAKTGIEVAEAAAQRLKKVYDETRDDQLKSVADTLKAKKAYEDQLAIVTRLRDAEAHRKSNAEALLKLQSEAKEKAEHPYGMLPAERALMEYKARPGVTAQQVEAARQALRPQLDEEVDAILRKAGLKRTTVDEWMNSALFGRSPLGPISRDAMQIRGAQFSGGFVGPSLDLTAKGQQELE